MGCSSLKLAPSISAFPDSTVGSACTSSVSRFARRSIALRPAHSRNHQLRDRYPGASDISSPPCLPRLLPAGANRRVGLAPTGNSAALSRRTWLTGDGTREPPGGCYGNAAVRQKMGPVSGKPSSARRTRHCDLEWEGFSEPRRLPSTPLRSGLISQKLSAPRTENAHRPQKHLFYGIACSLHSRAIVAVVQP
jgi:hypothetical protein